MPTRDEILKVKLMLLLKLVDIATKNHMLCRGIKLRKTFHRLDAIDRVLASL